MNTFKFLLFVISIVLVIIGSLFLRTFYKTEPENRKNWQRTLGYFCVIPSGLFLLYYILPIFFQLQFYYFIFTTLFSFL